MGEVLSIGKLIKAFGISGNYTYRTMHPSNGINRMANLPAEATSFIINTPISNSDEEFQDATGYGSLACVFVAFIRTSETTFADFSLVAGDQGTSGRSPCDFYFSSRLNEKYTGSTSVGSDYPITLSNGTLTFYARNSRVSYDSNYVFSINTIHVLVW